MRNICLTLILCLWATAAWTGTPAGDIPLEMPQGKVIVIPPVTDLPESSNSNTAIWTAVIGGVFTVAAAWISVRARRQK